MAQLKAGSTVGGVAIATDAPATIPVDNLTAPGGPLANGFIGVMDGALVLDTEENLTKPGGLGRSEGFISGGEPPGNVTSIDKFPYSASPGFTGTDVGELSLARSELCGQNSTTTGYASGGVSATDRVDSFPFTVAPVTATDEGNLRIVMTYGTGHSSQTDGFHAGGFSPPIPGDTAEIGKFPFTAPFVTGTDHGDLTQARRFQAGISDYDVGYSAGGYLSSPAATVNLIDSFPFSTSPFTATDEGNLSQARAGCSGTSSGTTAYSSGGQPAPAFSDRIDSFPFAAGPAFTATDEGNTWPGAMGYGTGVSSVQDSFIAGGTPTPPVTTPLNIVQKFPHSSPFTSATDFGDLFTTHTRAAGHNY